MTPFDLISAASFTKKNIMVTADDEKVYVPFLANRSFSFFQDTVLLANEMNRLGSSMTHRMQFDFYLHSARKRKRYAKWPKEETLEELELVMAFYDLNKDKARDTLRLLSKEDIEGIRAHLNPIG